MHMLWPLPWREIVVALDVLDVHDGVVVALDTAIDVIVVDVNVGDICG